MSDVEPPAAPQTPDGDPFSTTVERLKKADHRWFVLRVDGGMTTVVRTWEDGSVDFLFMLSRETAYGLREDTDGRRVWAVRGALDVIVGHAMRLHPPGHPQAPFPLAADSTRAERHEP